MDKSLIYRYLKQHALAVVSTISCKDKDSPEAALVGVAITKDLEIIFDTVRTSRKYKNLLKNPRIALVIGWNNETTVQYEGIAAELGTGDNNYIDTYFNAFPEGRQRAETWPDLVHFKITPTWIRYSDFNEPQITEEIKI